MQLFKKYFFVAYYLLLIVVLQMQQSEVMPSMASRLVYMVAVMWPLYSVKKDAMPIVIGLFFTITNYNFMYSYMPYEVYQYDLLIAIGLILGYRKDSPYQVKLPKFLYLWLILISVVNLITYSEITYLSYSILGLMLLWQFIKFGDRDQLQLMSLGFVVTGVVLSASFLIFGKDYMQAYYGGGGFERGGWTDPNYFGCAVGMGIVASGIELFQNRTSKLLKIGYIVAIWVMLTCLAMNASRGSLLSVSASCAVLVSMTQIKPLYKVLGVIVVLGAIYLLDDMGYFELLRYRIETDQNGGSGRTRIWANKLNRFFVDANLFNYIFGMGLEGGRALALDTHISTGFHNDYLAMFCEYGCLGFALFIKWLVYPFKAAFQNKGVVLSVIVYIAVCGMTLEPIAAGRFTYFIFWLYAIMLAFSPTKRKQGVI